MDLYNDILPKDRKSDAVIIEINDNGKLITFKEFFKDAQKIFNINDILLPIKNQYIKNIYNLIFNVNSNINGNKDSIIDIFYIKINELVDKLMYNIKEYTFGVNIAEFSKEKIENFYNPLQRTLIKNINSFKEHIYKIVKNLKVHQYNKSLLIIIKYINSTNKDMKLEKNVYIITNNDNIKEQRLQAIKQYQ